MGRRTKTMERTEAPEAAGVIAVSPDRLMPWEDVAAEFNRRTGEEIGRTGAMYIADSALRKMRKALAKWAEDQGIVAE